jgi:hypothetical protein
VEAGSRTLEAARHRIRKSPVIPIHELLARIRWDPEFGRGRFEIGYLDHTRDGGLIRSQGPA